MSQLLAQTRTLGLAGTLGALAVFVQAAIAQAPPPTFGVRGTVLDGQREPVAGAEVRLVLGNERGAKLADTTRTDALGRFSTRGWVDSSSDGEGDWRIEVNAPGRATSILDELFQGYGVYDVGPIFAFEPTVVRGRVMDESDRPIEGALVRVVPGSAAWSRYDYARLVPVAVSAKDGSFEFRSLPPGVATLGASAPGRADRVRRDVFLRADGHSTIDFNLPPEQPITGRVVGPDGAPRH